MVINKCKVQIISPKFKTRVKLLTDLEARIVEPPWTEEIILEAGTVRTDRTQLQWEVWAWMATSTWITPHQMSTQTQDSYMVKTKFKTLKMMASIDSSEQRILPKSDWVAPARKSWIASKLQESAKAGAKARVMLNIRSMPLLHSIKISWTKLWKIPVVK